MTAITEIPGTLNVGDSLNIARDLAVRGNLVVTGNIKVHGVAYIPSVSTEPAPGDSSGSTDFNSLLSELQAEVTARKNADTTLENAMGILRIDTAGAQNSARQSLSKAEEAVATAVAAAEAAESANQRVENTAADIRRDSEWWLFPVAGGASAVTTNGSNTVTFSKEGFRFVAGNRTYLIAPPLAAGVSFSFSLGESGYLCLNISRLFKLMPDQRISVSAVVEKVTSPSLIHPANHIPIAYCRSGELLRLLGPFGEIFG